MIRRRRVFPRGAFAAARRLALVLVALGWVAPGVSWGQGQAQPPEWRGNVSVGLLWQSGVTTQTGINLAGGVIRADPTAWSHSIEGDFAYSEVEFSGVTQTVADSQHLRYMLERSLTSRLFVAFRPAFKRNKIQRVDHQVEGLFGLGIRAVNNERVRVNLVPIVGFVNQEKNVAAVDGNNFTYGILQSADARLSSVWTFTQYALFLQNSKDSEDYRFQARASIVGVIAGPLAANLTYTFDRENIVFGASEQADQRVSVGLQVNF